MDSIVHIVCRVSGAEAAGVITPAVRLGTLFPDGQCENVVCSKQRGLDGCYECFDLPACSKGYYNIQTEYIAKVSAIFIQRYGKACFEETLKKAMDDGVAYPKGILIRPAV